MDVVIYGRPQNLSTYPSCILVVIIMVCTAETPLEETSYFIYGISAV